jgi:hypothetical protein
MKKTILVLLVCFFILGSSLDLSSQEWSQFRGYDRSGKVTGFKAPSKWPAEITPSWKIKVGTGDASPVLSGKFTSTPGRVQMKQLFVLMLKQERISGITNMLLLQ